MVSILAMAASSQYGRLASAAQACRADAEPFVAGDLLFFLGDDELSQAIAWKTATWAQWLFGLSFSHVGICASVGPSMIVQGATDGVLLFESTTLCELPCIFAKTKVSGVQAHLPQQRIDAYPGKVWRMRLTEPLDGEESGKLTGFLTDKLGRPYDAERAALLAGRRFVYDFQGLAPTHDSLFCSELVSAACKRVDRIVPRGIDPESYSPNLLARAALHSGEVWPIGESKQSRRIK